MRSTWTLCAIVGVGSLAGAAAQAQTEGSNPPGDTGTPPEAPSLQEVVVTAQRREESLQRAALSIDAIGAEQLAGAGVTEAEHLTQLSPSLQVAPGGGPYSMFSVRGISNFAVNAFGDTAIAFNVDGVYLARPTAAHGVFYDLERVEVVKGPQGILYGRNATGGAINVITRRPTLGKWNGDLALDVGDYGKVVANGALNAPIGERAALRVAFQSVKRDGYFSSGTDDEDGWAGRVSLRVDPSDDLSLLLRADYAKQDGKGAGSTALVADGDHGKPLADDRVGLEDQGALYVPPNSFIPTSRPLPTDVFNDNAFYGAMLEAQWTTSAGTLTVLPAYRKVETRFLSNVPAFYLGDLGGNSRQDSLEARFASNGQSAFRYVVGAYYLNEDVGSHQIFENAIGGTTSDQSVDSSTKTWAAFSQLTFALSDTFRLVAGGRYTSEDKRTDSQRWDPTRFQPPALPPNPPCNFSRATGTCAVGPPVFDMHESKNWTSTTWKAGVEWDARPSSLLYANVSTGFKAGGFFFGPTGNNTYEPEKVTAYTVGSKNRFLYDRLQLNAEVFYLDYKDQQISHLVQTNRGPLFVTSNAGTATVQGAEAQLEYLLPNGTKISGQVQYLDTRYDDLTLDVPAFADNYFGCALASTAAGINVRDCSGKPLLQSPKWTLALALEHSFKVGQGATLTPQLSSRYESERDTAYNYIAQTRSDKYTSTDFSLSFAPASGHWYTTAYVRNIENDDVISFAFPNPGYPAINVVSGTLKPPRTYGLQVGAHF